MKHNDEALPGTAQAEQVIECAAPPCLMREVDPAYFWHTPETPSEERTSCDKVEERSAR